MKEYLKVANDPILWLICLPVVAMVGVQAIIFSKRAFVAAKSAELTKQECKDAFRIGAVAAIGPAVAVFVVMLGMMAVVGGPMTWLRLSVIGSAPTELAASTMGAKAMGVEFGGEGYGVLEYANSVWAMTLNGIGWLVFAGLFTHKLEGMRNKFAKGDSKLIGEISGAAMLGAMAYLLGGHLIAGGGRLVSALAAGIAMILLGMLSQKFPKLVEYNLGIAMVVGMVAGVIYV
ncbi:DUF5058 family protein [Clostridium sp. Cult2]|uniref:DUF5058 family protein n=1 Tax=Clostridium sp. Cult2 TaxID=2079003 RepID=UPI001F2555F8|nr:DUF5058 family protein [Clostridium sp. Cult2]MCF6464761.1 DUF5058 domain-containing protein [Clostridium sp. Cult2]